MDRLGETIASVKDWVRGTKNKHLNLLQYQSSLRAYESFFGQVRKKREDDWRRQQYEQTRLLEELSRIERARQEKARRRQKEQEEAARKRKEQEESRRRQKAYWKSLDGPTFEKEMAQLLQRKGFRADRRGRSGDGGVDILVRCQRRTIIVQCKAFKSHVGPGMVRDLYGTLLHVKADEAWLLTTSGFSHRAKLFAKDKPIRLLTIDDVLAGNFKCDDG